MSDKKLTDDEIDQIVDNNATSKSLRGFATSAEVFAMASELRAARAKLAAVEEGREALRMAIDCVAHVAVKEPNALGIIPVLSKLLGEG